MLPREQREDFYVTASRMGDTMRRLMAGRLVGMVFEGVFTWVMLSVYGVPMAALLGILTGLLAFIPNLGALIAGVLMVLVGFSGGTDMGLYTILVYFVGPDLRRLRGDPADRQEDGRPRPGAGARPRS